MKPPVLYAYVYMTLTLVTLGLTLEATFAGVLTLEARVYGMVILKPTATPTL